MPYAFVQDVPADEKMYREVTELLPTEAPAGLVAHFAVKRDGGLRYIDVWETKDAWDTFHHDLLDPAVEKVLAGYGLPHTRDGVTFEEIDVVDVWVGDAR